MPSVNWAAFGALPGAADLNFEMLCRALIRRHYAPFGEFAALANQPGVEFHLKLSSSCSLGEAGRWYGWQCRWYDLPSGRAIGATRRRKIEEAIATTEAELPDLTDWVLWTRHALTAGDQAWFRGIQTHMRLHLWTAAEVEEHLSGPAEVLRGTYFGELVLTPASLAELHTQSVAPIKRRWQPEVHQVVDAERALRRALGAVAAWSDLVELAERLERGTASVVAESVNLPTLLAERAGTFVAAARELAVALKDTFGTLSRGDYEVLRQNLGRRTAPSSEWDVFVRRLRAGRQPAVLPATNVLADLHTGHDALMWLRQELSGQLIAVIADAGCGKTELAAEVTAEADDRPAGVLLHGRDLHAGNNLDDLARSVIIHAKPVASFEALVAAVDAAGERARRRLPIVIDGLNEAEDPRDWKAPLAALSVILSRYPHVVVICTLRSAFTAEAVPDDVDRLEIPHFEDDTADAVRRYFQHYRIDAADAELPWGLLRHPLTLRLFCEVTNPERKRTVGVEAMPGSLTALFDRYLEQVADRVAQLAPRTRRYYESDIRTALDEIGIALWEENARNLDLQALRRRLNDEARPWDESIIRALEHDGVLFREPGDRPGRGRIAVLWDALAGHLIADALLSEHGGAAFETWLRSPETLARLTGDSSERHPFATDTFRALVGLFPRRMHRRQLWPLLDEPARTEALQYAAWLEGSYLDRETVEQLATLIIRPPTGRIDLFDRVQMTRAARSHPLDAQFLDALLRPMPMLDRDLRWTEWVRRRQGELIKDSKRLEERWQADESRDVSDRLRAQWIMWTLSSTVRLLRDHATRALYWFGAGDPDALFALTIQSLSVNDPYVPERMLAACYGVAMGYWAHPAGARVRAALPIFANTLIDRMFVPDAPHSTRHVLARDYALGLITLASRVAPGCVTGERLTYLQPPFAHLPSPFPPAAEIADAEIQGANKAIHMDFGNYTLGRLIPDRGNYDYKHPTYQEVRRQLEYRIVQLGYLPIRFASIDRDIGEDAWRAESRGRTKTDRYGKKYSWIAFFEMYGVREDEGTLPEWRAGERTSDADIDPSFPEPARVWAPPVPDPFASAPATAREWLANGPTPDYSHLLQPDEVDGERGPWVLLDGYLEQSAKNDARRVFTFLRGAFLKGERIAGIVKVFDTREYPGNDGIPGPRDDHYTYAGEIPWSPRFGSDLRGPNGTAKRDIREAFVAHDGKRWLRGIPVEVPVYRFAWESYHSALNQVGGITVPAPAVCERLKLVSRRGEWDLYDSKGDLATLYRESKGDEDDFRSHLLYLRKDLAARYLKRTNQALVWLVWGERGFDHRSALALGDALRDVYSRHKQIHRYTSWWNPSLS